jgi:hypothetical protein
MGYVIKNMGRVAAGHDGQQGWYLKEYDPEAFGGVGYINWTPNRAEAKKYASKEEAWEEYKRRPTNHPTRFIDGRPNRPLTAYSVEILYDHT